MNDRALGRARRHRRLRKRVAGMPNRLRMNVFRSHKHLYVQLINDVQHVTMFGCSTKALQRDKKAATSGNVNAAQQLGKHLAEEAIKRGIRQVVFDRGGYQYHGRVQAVAEAARKAGLTF